MKQNHHKEAYDQDDEILLKYALLFLFNSKWIILGITSLITMISIVYVKSITPMYEAVVSVYPPSSLSVSKINNARFKHDEMLPTKEKDFSKEELYEMVLYKLNSNSFKEKVFTSNNYLEKINLNNESGNFSTLDFVKKVKNKPIDANKTTTFVLMGENPLIISNFLNDLMRVALLDTLEDINLMEQEKIDSRLSYIETELNLEKMNLKKIRLLKIKQLQKELKIAVSLKNKEFNFPQLNQIADNSLKIHPSSTEAMPIWYLYGEQALLQELDKLTSDKTVNNSKIDVLESQKAEFSSVDISDISDIEVAGVNRSEVPTSPISPKKRLFVTVMFFISLIISIFIAYLVSVLREKQKYSLSTV
jgi:LPS O-antigen subunit length determinant protein (WzzB/FepE family)